MLSNKKSMSSDFSAHDQLSSAREFCEMVPGAVSLWSRERSVWMLNEAAKRLINYSETDFVHRHSLWVERIHPDDREEYCEFVKNLHKKKLPVRCDYRFFPRHAHRPVWIREDALVLGCRQNGVASDIISALTDISDLKRAHWGKTKTNGSDPANLSMHEFQNYIHKIAMELELTQMDLQKTSNSAELKHVIELLDRLLSDLRDQVFKIVESRTYHDPLTILAERRAQREKRASTAPRQATPRAQEAPPIVEGDKEQLHNVFEPVFEFCGAMVKDGGRVTDRGRRKKIGHQAYAKVKVKGTTP
jgi:hypothetical protein